jgi:hypothetical protein
MAPSFEAFYEPQAAKIPKNITTSVTSSIVLLNFSLRARNMACM